MSSTFIGSRNVVFISKATPGDDEFVLWLAPRLEAAGYAVYADILRLDPGMRWRQELTTTLQSKAIKMLLCGQDSSLSRNGVQEEIGIAEDLVKELKDPQFIIPLRIQPYKKVFGIGELQYVDFSKSWADGLNHLLDALHKQNVPRDTSSIRISPNWEQYRQRNAVQIKNEPEALTSNWLRVVEIPDTVRYFSPTGAVDHAALQRAAGEFEYHARAHERGFFSFASLDDVNEKLVRVGKFEILLELDTLSFVTNGFPDREIKGREAANWVQSIFRKAWEAYAKRLGLLSFTYPTRRLQDPATVGWNLATGLYYKTQAEPPWKLASARPGVAYIGLVYKLLPNDPSEFACCAAQMFLAEGDGVVFRGANGPWKTGRNEFHLKPPAAKKLIGQVLDTYRDKHGGPPKELFIHGRTTFNDEEWDAFKSTVPKETTLVGVRIKTTYGETKLFRNGDYPVLRGTAIILDSQNAYFWTTGYLPQLDTYIGPETPNPLFISVLRTSNEMPPLEDVLNDIMGLTKINYNACNFNDGLPVTVRFAGKVGDVLSMGSAEGAEKQPFKFYV